MDKIIVAGHVCLDLTPTYKGKKADKIEDILKPGTLINAEKCDVHTGGVVANTGLALKELGADVLLAGKIGDDPFGRVIKDSFKEYKADNNLIVSKDEMTSYSVVIAFPGIDRTFIHSPGANDTFCSQDISDELLNQASHFHFGYPPLMKRMYNGSGAHLAVLLKRVKKMGLTTSLDMAAIDPDSAAGRVNWKRVLGNVLPYVDFFVPSFEELCFMLDPKRLDMRNRQAEKDNVDVTMVVSIEDDIKPLAQQCLEMGAKVVMIKCGAQGMYYRTAKKEVILDLCSQRDFNIDEWAGKEGFEYCFEPDKIVSGTGAGDASIAGFLISIIKKYSVERCISIAAGCGALCVTRVDAISGLMPLDILEEKIDAGWKKKKVSVKRKEDLQDD